MRFFAWKGVRTLARTSASAHANGSAGRSRSSVTRARVGSSTRPLFRTRSRKSVEVVGEGMVGREKGRSVRFDRNRRTRSQQIPAEQSCFAQVKIESHSG